MEKTKYEGNDGDCQTEEMEDEEDEAAEGWLREGPTRQAPQRRRQQQNCLSPRTQGRTVLEEREASERERGGRVKL